MKRTLDARREFSIGIPGGRFSSLHVQRALGSVQRELRRPGAYLLPLRVFIGIGWLRAFAEKVAAPAWYDGSSLTAFLTQQLADGAVVFPFYESLILQVFLPNAQALGHIVMLGQLLAGLAIIMGFFSNAALLGGLFMSFNFLLAGVPNPTTFYVVIQAALLATQAGAVLGVDGWLSTKRPASLRVAQARQGNRQRTMGLLLMSLALLGAALAFGSISDFSPAGSVEDPAAVMVVLLSMASSYGVITFLRS